MACRSGDTQTEPLQLPLSVDKRTVMYVKFAKVMLIFQGSVNDHRVKLISTLKERYQSSCRVISDATYKSETGLSFGLENAEDFYKYFKSTVKQTCESGYNLIVIDQSMSNSNQMQYYLFLAQKFQYVVLPVPALIQEKSSAKERGIKNLACSFSRNVPINFPNYFNHHLCGWFLHDVDSADLRQEVAWYAKDCFKEIVNFDDWFSHFSKPEAFEEYYQMEDTRQDLAFCLVKIIKSPMDANEYMSKAEFQKYYGFMTRLYVVGFIISPHIVAARVKLTFDQKKLWMLPDDLPENFQPKVYPSDLKKHTKVNISDESVKLIASKSNRTINTGDAINNPELAIPYNAKGRSCHILLGKVKNAPKRNVDYDVPFAVHREQNFMENYKGDVKRYEWPQGRCIVRRIGKYWFIYLKETLYVNGLFATYCDADTNIV